MIDAESIRNAHRNCGCLTEDRLDTVDYSPHSLRRHGCQLKIRGLRLAINCDSCRAYGSNDIRPDLFVLRETDGTCEWIVIEIQSTMDRAATRQVAAGLRTLAEDPLFADSLNCKPRVLFAFKRGVRTQELQQLRQPLRSRGRTVPSDIKRCGSTTV